MARAIAAVAVLAALAHAAAAPAAPMGEIVYVDPSKAPAADAKADEPQPTSLDTIVVTPLDPLYDTQLYRRLKKDLPTLGTDGKPTKKKRSKVVKVLAWMFLPSDPPAEIDTSEQVINQIRAREMGIDR